MPAIPAIIAAVIRQSAMCPPVYFLSGVRGLPSSITTTDGELETPAGTTVMGVGAAAWTVGATGIEAASGAIGADGAVGVLVTGTEAASGAIGADGAMGVLVTGTEAASGAIGADGAMGVLVTGTEAASGAIGVDGAVGVLALITTDFCSAPQIGQNFPLSISYPQFSQNICIFLSVED